MSTHGTEADERYYDNPIYGGTSALTWLQQNVTPPPSPPLAYEVPVAHPRAFPNAAQAVYDATNTVSTNSVGKQKMTYNVLKRGKANGNLKLYIVYIASCGTRP